MISFDESWFQLLDEEIEAGNVRVAKSPDKPLKIYNYTQKAQFSEHWNEVTRKTRGLILNNKNPVVVPPEKFFNLGEKFAANVDLNNARISQKSDGYMIMVKVDSDWGLIIASRGSFDNKYVEAAKKFLTDDVVSKLISGYTYFCELCQNFPGDESIILTKHPIPKLVCWAIKDENFNEIIPDDKCPFPIVQELSLPEAEKYLQQKVEGVVAQDLETGQRVKIKTKYFLENHRLISDCTQKRVWEILSSGGKVENLDIPDEFMPQMKEWQDELLYNHHLIQSVVQNEFNARVDWTDKQIALDDALSPEMKAFIFTLKKKGLNSLSEQIWTKLKPRNVL